jgi:hypothetical protein
MYRNILTVSYTSASPRQASLIKTSGENLTKRRPCLSLVAVWKHSHFLRSAIRIQAHARIGILPSSNRTEWAVTRAENAPAKTLQNSLNVASTLN